MSSALTLARPYARAAFELARTEQAAAGWSSALAFAAQLAASEEVVDLIGNPRIKPQEQLALFLPDGVAAGSAFGNFLSLLVENGRLSVLPQIAELYEEHRAEAEKTLLVHVRSAAAIEPAQQEGLKAALSRRFDRSIQLEIQIDTDLLGGAIIDAGEVVIDGSLRGKLGRLKAGLAA
jgi:F-type H+-transporting ATPase subunit delta